MDATTLYDTPIPALARPASTQPPWEAEFSWEVPSRLVTSTDTSGYSDPNSVSALGEHWAKLREIQTNPAMWPEEGAPPSENALGLAGIALERLDRLGFAPSRVVASAEGGVGVCFVQGNKYADIEILNTGEILGVTSNRRDRPVVWEIDQSAYSLAKAAIRIREFFKASPTSKDDAKRESA